MSDISDDEIQRIVKRVLNSIYGYLPSRSALPLRPRSPPPRRPPKQKASPASAKWWRSARITAASS